MTNPRRGEVWYADMKNAVGSEQKGFRPVLIIQNDIGNKYSPTVIIAPLTSKKKKEIPTHVVIDGYNGFLSNSIVLLEQIKTIDKALLCRYVTKIDDTDLNRIDDAIKISLDIH